MGRIDLDQHWPLPPYRERAESRGSERTPEPPYPEPLYPEPPYPEHPHLGQQPADHRHAEPPNDGEDAGEPSRRGLDEAALAKALTVALSARAGGDDRPRAEGSPTSLPLESAIERPSDHRESQRRVTLPLVWCGLGFAAGIVASHLIGFWSFVSNVVVNGRDGHATRTAVSTVATTAPRSDIAQKVVINPPEAERAGVTAAAARCIALSIDRALGQTHRAGCEAQETALRDAGFRRRGDLVAARPRLQDPAAWSNTTAVQPDLETGTLQASDVELKLDP